MTDYRRGAGRIRPVLGSSDVYSRKHIDRQLDRLDRLRVHDKQRIRLLEEQVGSLLSLVKKIKQD